MDTMEFLQRVLPAEGFYVITVLNEGRGPRQGFFSSVTDLAKAVTASDERGNNTYYAISSYKDKGTTEKRGTRTQDNVLYTRVLALDVDCAEDKPFATWKDGLRALSSFVAAAGMPKPMVVHSGRGLHVYWVMTEDLSPDQWTPLAEALKSATRAHEFRVDIGLVANSALVLRPVGTHNPKNGNEVRLLIDAPAIPRERLSAALDPYLGIPSAMPARKPTVRPVSPLAQAMSIEYDLPPANAGLIVSKCQQVRWCVEHQDEVDEPLWYALLGVAAYCEDPEEVAIIWSNRHPNYTKEETLRKLAQWKAATTGPTTCAKFDELHPGCAGCKFAGKVGTPVRLGIQYKEVDVPDDAPQAIAAEIPMPRGFKRTADGVKFTLDDTDLDVTPFDIYPVAYGKDESLKYEVVRYHWYRKHVGWQELALRQADLTQPRTKDFTTAIADQGIVLATVKQTEFFQMLLRSYMEELRQRRALTNLYATMGWKAGYSEFVIGDTVLRRAPDGTISSEDTTLAASSQRLGNELWRTAGTLEGWVAFTSLMEKTNLNAHMFALGVSLSAPLYAFSGLNGLTISLYGPTGGGKTLAQYWQQSVWGNPEKLHFAAKYTQNTLFSRMGMYCHLPMTVDEATMVPDKDVGEFLYWVSQGRDKARLARTAEERDAKTWATPMTISTNRSWQAKMIASGLDTDAQAARLLELNVPVHPMFVKDSEAGRRIYMFLHSNYGMVGREFLKRLLELGPAGIQAMIAEATASFQKRYKCNFAGSERYWELAIVLADLALRMAKDWDLIRFTPATGIEWALSQIGAIRRAVADNRLDAHDMLSEYLSEFADAQVQVFHIGGQKPTLDYSRVPRNELRIRFDFYRKTATDPISHGTVLIDRTHLRRWLASKGADWKTFTADMDAEGVIATPRSEKAYLAKDTPIKLGQTYVIGINLDHPRTVGILTDADQSIEDMAYKHLRAVS